MGIKRFIIKKHIISEGKMFFTNFSAFISIFGVAIGVASLIVVLSVTSGFQKAYKEKILAHSGEIFIRKYSDFTDYKDVLKKISKINGIKGATPTNDYQILISSKSGDRGAQIKAIDPKTVDNVSNFFETIKPKGSWERFINGKKQILIGSAIADSMNLKVGDQITITFPFTKDGRVSSQPKILSFNIAGFVDTGMYQFDNHYTYVSLDNAYNYFGSSVKVKGIEVKIEDSTKSREIANKIKKAIGHYEYPVTTFEEMYSNLFRSLEYQKFFISLVLIIIMILASFSIVGTLLIFVTEKEKDIALLKAIGVSRFQLMMLFIMEGTVLGIMGIILGFILSAILLFLVNAIDVGLNPDIYNISYIPISVVPHEVLIVVSVTMLISILATIYPSYKAAKLNPAAGLSGNHIEEYSLYAGLGKRFFAKVIDNIICISIIITYLALSGKYKLLLAFFERNVDFLALGLKFSYILITIFVIRFIVVFLFLYIWQATPGKMLFSIKIIDSKTYEKPSILKFIIRYFTYILSSLSLYLGLITAIWNPKKQTWHDKFSKTIVINNDVLEKEKKKLKN